MYIYIYIYTYIHTKAPSKAPSEPRQHPFPPRKNCPGLFERRPIQAFSAEEPLTLKIHQRGVQWKQGVVIYIMSYTSSLHNTTPIHCTPLPLHPPVVNTHTGTYP